MIERQSQSREKLRLQKVAFVFPGQGSQYAEMASPLLQYRSAQRVFEQANSTLAIDPPLLDLCTNPEYQSLLDQTVYTQPALFTTCVAALRVLEEIRPDLKPDAVGGHSVGEYAALVAAGVVDFSDGLRLISERARLMTTVNGAMGSIVGLSIDEVEKICLLTKAEIAAVNSEKQVSISGKEDTIIHALLVAKEHCARLAVRLPISIPAHSSEMKTIQAEFATIATATQFDNPTIPFFLNETGLQATSAAEIRDSLIRQLTQPVQWNTQVRNMHAYGIGEFIEIGPGDVLTKLVKRSNTGAGGRSIFACISS